MSFSEHLAAFVADHSVPVPAEAASRAVDAFVDTIGVAFAGKADTVCNLAGQLCSPHPEGSSTILGEGRKTSADLAAYLNAVAIHAIDYDDSSPKLRGHPSATLVPVALALAEEQGSSGAELLRAYIIGLETGARIAAGFGAQHYMHGFHTTATVGIFGATAVAARLLKLSQIQTQHAFGFAASRVSGLVRSFGTSAKALQVGNAARGAVEAARASQLGATADGNIFDGPQGIFAVFGCGAPVPSVEDLASLGKVWSILEDGVYAKRWPCCYAVHRPVAGLRQLLAEGLDPRAVTRIKVGFLPGVEHPLLYKSPKTGLEAKFSIEYALAAVLLDGDLGIASFEEAAVQRPEAQALLPIVERYAIEHERFFNGLTGYTDLIVETRTTRHEIRIDRTPGSPDWRFTEQEQTAKFLDCVRPALTEAGAQNLLRDLRGLAARATLAGLFDLTA